MENSRFGIVNKIYSFISSSKVFFLGSPVDALCFPMIQFPEGLRPQPFGATGVAPSMKRPMLTVNSPVCPLRLSMVWILLSSACFSPGVRQANCSLVSGIFGRSGFSGFDRTAGILDNQMQILKVLIVSACFIC